MVLIKKFYRWSYLVLTVLVAVILVMAIISSASDSSDVFSNPLIWVVFGIYIALGVVCLVFSDLKISLYKVGSLLLHVGLLVMLVGFIVTAVASEEYYLRFTPRTAYDGFTDENGNYIEFGFGMEIDDFTVEKYESGGDKYYRADLILTDKSTGEVTTDILEVNNTMRKNGWKVYLMGYTDGSSEFEAVYGKFDFDYVASGDSWKDVSDDLDRALSGYNVSYRYYYSSLGNYVEVEKAALENSITTAVTARVLVDGNDAYVYVNTQGVTLLFKQDPGEYAVLAGMIVIIAGVVLTCLVRRRKKGEEMQ